MEGLQDLRGKGGPASGHPSLAPAAASVRSRRAPPRRHSARPLPPRPTGSRELRPRLTLFRLRQPRGGRDEFPEPPPRERLGAEDGQVEGRPQLLPPAPRVQARARAPGAAERAASPVLTERCERPRWATRGRCGAGGHPSPPASVPRPLPARAQNTLALEAARRSRSRGRSGAGERRWRRRHHDPGQLLLRDHVLRELPGRAVRGRSRHRRGGRRRRQRWGGAPCPFRAPRPPGRAPPRPRASLGGSRGGRS